MKRSSEFEIGEMYFNPSAGPLWMCTGSTLEAQTSITGKKLRVAVNEDLSHFFRTLVPANQADQQQRIKYQEQLHGRYRIAEKIRYDYAQRW